MASSVFVNASAVGIGMSIASNLSNFTSWEMRAVGFTPGYHACQVGRMALPIILFVGGGMSSKEMNSFPFPTIVGIVSGLIIGRIVSVVLNQARLFMGTPGVHCEILYHTLRKDNK